MNNAENKSEKEKASTPSLLLNDGALNDGALDDGRANGQRLKRRDRPRHTSARNQKKVPETRKLRDHLRDLCRQSVLVSWFPSICPQART